MLFSGSAHNSALNACNPLVWLSDAEWRLQRAKRELEEAQAEYDAAERAVEAQKGQKAFI